MQNNMMLQYNIYKYSALPPLIYDLQYDHI
jgi:hypothetical protein